MTIEPNSMGPYTVEHHGVRGFWYKLSDSFSTMYDALTMCEQLKSEGYGARIVRVDGTVAMDASWQTPVDWTVAS